jgi:hypothetical protein
LHKFRVFYLHTSSTICMNIVNFFSIFLSHHIYTHEKHNNKEEDELGGLTDSTTYFT